MGHNLTDSPSVSDTPSKIPAYPRTIVSLASSYPYSKASSKSETPTGSPTERLKKSVLACNHCRQKKTKCSSHRPSCVSCLRSNRTCVYASTPSDRAAGSREKRPEASPVLPESDPILGPNFTSTLGVALARPRPRKRARTDSQLGGPKTRQRGSHTVSESTLTNDPETSRWVPSISCAPSPVSQSPSEAMTSLSPLFSRSVMPSTSSCPSSSTMSTMSTMSIPTPQGDHATCDSVENPSSSAIVDYQELAYNSRVWSSTPAWLEQPSSSVIPKSPVSAVYHPIPMYPSFSWPVPAATTSEISPTITTATSLALDNPLDPYVYTPPSTAASVASTCTNISNGDHLFNYPYPFQFSSELPFSLPEHPFSSVGPEESFFSIPAYSAHHDLPLEPVELDRTAITKVETEPEMEPEWGYPHTLHSLHQSLAIHVNPPMRKRVSDLWNVQSLENPVVDPLSAWS
ncbi:Zn(2)-C6 fungal-type DNA-binding domain [Phaffia rhodozyma]|uniref:Zn(2)-C6 fungal-type DNA-binding domain n=1 Tax=Phaffia rhodozyma TaxID=264483 RepID=A0A0F7SY07_PHARH|nr:Zn(2)-C6 fungal-type DNA-binding domain [Phaffia rhodozyma]